MFCGLTCAIALVFLIANIYIILISSYSFENKKKFLNLLNEDQKKKYKLIINERKNIYYAGYVFGILLSLLIVIINKNLKKKITNVSLVCIVGFVTFLTNYLFYILYPKSDYMLLHLTNKEQIFEWLAIYRKMQFNYHFGFVLGIIAVMIFCYGFR